MGIYSRHVLPRLIDRAMRLEELTALRASVVPAARGVVLDVGIGSGLNLSHYSPSRVTHLYGIDPSAGLLAIARSAIDGHALRVTLMNESAERIPLPDESIDTAVLTWSLCSIAEPEAALHEIRRVLRPGGSLLFVEHGLSPDARVRSWQNRITPVWRHLAGGCHLNRNIEGLIRSAGFSISRLDTRYIAGPRPVTYTYSGAGTRA
jgi:ubiquinone/menaquinone biosynthesis C-methylase UbiE